MSFLKRLRIDAVFGKRLRFMYLAPAFAMFTFSVIPAIACKVTSSFIYQLADEIAHSRVLPIYRILKSYPPQFSNVFILHAANLAQGATA